MTYANLDELFDALVSGEYEGDWSDCPTFGGEDIKDTSEIWSWDATRKIVGTCADDLTIEDR